MTTSIIICAYNEEENISRCIDSVIAQTYSDWELWIVNDGSTDSTAHIVQQYVEQDQRIHLTARKPRTLFCKKIRDKMRHRRIPHLY